MTARKAPAKSASASAPSPAPLPGVGLGRIAYEAYSASVGGKSVTGQKLPSWDEQVTDKHEIAAAWCAAAQAVITATITRST